MVVMQDDIEAMTIKLRLKAAGQKVGFAEVSIRLIREEARVIKAGVRAMLGCIKPINLMWTMPKHHLSLKPNQKGRTSSYTLRGVQQQRNRLYERDFRCCWDELVIMTKPKGIAREDL